ncbi:RST1-like protein [Drosera capensis]
MDHWSSMYFMFKVQSKYKENLRLFHRQLPKTPPPSAAAAAAMDAAAAHALKTPHPSLQRQSIHHLFITLRSSPPNSDASRTLISRLLQSNSPAIIDQAVREWCGLVRDGVVSVRDGVAELVAGVEEVEGKAVGVVVKGVGCVVRLGFGRGWEGMEGNPFVKNVVQCDIRGSLYECSVLEACETWENLLQVLQCQAEVDNVLAQEVLLFVAHCRQYGMKKVCKFLRPLLMFSILRVPFLDAPSYSFTRRLVSSLASLACTFPSEAMPLLMLLNDCLGYCQCKSAKDLSDVVGLAEVVVDAYIVILRHSVTDGTVIHKVQLNGVDLLEALLAIYSIFEQHNIGCEDVINLVSRLLGAQKDLGLRYVPELSTTVLYLCLHLTVLELEHEQSSILSLLSLLLDWKSKDEFSRDGVLSDMAAVVPFEFPIIHLMSSPSKSIKGAASNLLSSVEKLPRRIKVLRRSELSVRLGNKILSKPETIIHRLLQHLWSQDLLSTSFFVNISSNSRADPSCSENGSISWVSQIRAYALQAVERRRSSFQALHSQEMLLTEMPLLFSALIGLLLLHPSLASFSADALSALGIMEPKLGVTLLLAILYYNNSMETASLSTPDMLLLKLLEMLPPLARDTSMVSLVVQTITPMLQKRTKSDLYAAAVRLLCKSWEFNDQIFGVLQDVLLPERFREVVSDRTIVLSLAASVRDVCKVYPDRGVDLILSVSLPQGCALVQEEVCSIGIWRSWNKGVKTAFLPRNGKAAIESSDPLIQVLGLQSLGYLCEADAVDFYTAWSIIEKQVLDYTADPIVACGLCELFRWGAMDAEAYPDASKNILQILWNISSSDQTTNEALWTKARVAAFVAINQFEIGHIEICIVDFKERFIDLLIHETNMNTLQAIEHLGSKIITHEHSTRKRLVKEKKAPRNKVEKLLEVFPRLTFSPGQNKSKELPDAALLCKSFCPENSLYQLQFKTVRDVLGQYASAMKEITISLQLSRNVIMALISLQSWKPFMQRWLSAYLSFLDKDPSSKTLDKTSKAANDILKAVLQMAEGSIPRSSENIAIAVGALCAALPPSVHAAKETASKFLSNWLFQHEHEHRQWAAAISLGFVSSVLHTTDREQKLHNVNGLIQAAQDSRSTLVKGACGIGLGFLCQGLFTHSSVVETASDEGSLNSLETESLGKIVRCLSLTLCQITRCSSGTLQFLSRYVPLASDQDMYVITSESVCTTCEERDEDVWGIAGIIIGLGSCVGPLYRVGSYEAASSVKSLLVSWITNGSLKLQRSSNYLASSEALLTCGACLALSSIVSFCQRVEMVQDTELNELVVCYKEIISHLLSLKTLSNVHQSLLIASCVGAGNLVASILNEGVHYLDVQLVKQLLELYKKIYSGPYPHIVTFGGMLGVVNMMGAGAGIISFDYHAATSFPPAHVTKESSGIVGPLLSNPDLEADITSLVQDMFLLAQNSDDREMRECATWALCFLGRLFWPQETHSHKSIRQTGSAEYKSTSAGISEDSVVFKLSLWLAQLDYSRPVNAANVGTVATVLRCLSRAPRLPSLEWGAVIRRCMRYEDHVDKVLPRDSNEKGALRQECFLFSLSHANNVDLLMSLVDELSDLSRFRTLDLNLQSTILCHLSDLTGLFSSSRLEKLFTDIGSYFSSAISPYQHYGFLEKSMLRISYWKGLCQSLGDVATSELVYLPAMETCTCALLSVMPGLSTVSIPGEKTALYEEWNESTRCLGKAREAWLLDLLQISEVDLVQRDAPFNATLKKIQIRAWLVRSGSLPLSELGKLKASLLKSGSQGLWDVLVEFVSALQPAEGSVKRQWLVDVLQISCVTRFPSTALQFLGLLSGSCCKYMPLLILDATTVLSDLPVTLPSLLSAPNWRSIAEKAVSYLWTSTERIHEWSMSLASGSPAPIDQSENDMADFLMRVMRETCFSLREYLPLEKQLKLADMMVY